ncbi:MAG: hypothetical protein Q8L99_06395 [Polycyclovorans sp.]|nr:hypothetical protein [Polycyclovorans sp.]
MRQTARLCSDPTTETGMGQERVMCTNHSDEGESVKTGATRFKAVAGLRANRPFSRAAQCIDFVTQEGGDNELDAGSRTLEAIVTPPSFNAVSPSGTVGERVRNPDGRTGGGRTPPADVEGAAALAYGIRLRVNVTNTPASSASDAQAFRA